jgi:hypothetical protein
MPYLIATDEAGLGPNLGPLVVSATAWELPHRIFPANLYDILCDTVVSSAGESDQDRFAVADSKQLYKPGGTKAHLEITGRVEGTARGATTKMQLMGKYHFDLGAKRVTWFGLLVKDVRSQGHVDAGFEAVSRVQIRITPDVPSDHLTDAALAAAVAGTREDLTRLYYESADGAWNLTHDRRWFVRGDAANRVSLRFIDRGDKLAQCSVSSLPKLADPNQVSLEDFRKDVAHALGDKLHSFARVSQWHNEADYRVFRVVAEGISSDVPIHWIYYLVADEHGRRMALAFVVERGQLSRFDDADRELIGALRLFDSKISSNPPRALRR